MQVGLNIKRSPVWGLGKQPLAFNVKAGRWRVAVVAAVTLKVNVRVVLIVYSSEVKSVE